MSKDNRCRYQWLQELLESFTRHLPFQTVRGRALAATIVALMLCAVLMPLAIALLDSMLGIFLGGVTLALPVVPLIWFVTELVTGIPNGEIANRWYQFPLWKRGLMILSLATMFLVVIFVVTMFSFMSDPVKAYLDL